LALTREQKETLVQGYADRLSKAQVLILGHNKGLSVGQISGLRSELRKSGAEGVIVKNTLFRLALEQADLPVDKELMSGPMFVTFVYDDIAPAAKAVVDASKEREAKIDVLGGIIDGQLAGADQIDVLTTLPSREALLGQVVGGIAAPMSGLVGTLAAVMRGLLTVLNGRSEQLEAA